MKVVEYIEKCKTEIGWDNEAEREWQQIKKSSELFHQLAPLIDKRINELRIKIDVGMAGSVDEAEFKKYQEILPLTLGDKPQ